MNRPQPRPASPQVQQPTLPGVETVDVLPIEILPEIDRRELAGHMTLRKFKQDEVVYHQGALAAVARSVEKPEEVTEVNVGGTLNVLVASRDAKVRRVVFASSSSVYGDTPELPKVESMPLSPRSPYAASKAAGEA